MKKCEQFKDLILTDYMDGELDKELKTSVESHLLDCGDCRAFFKEVKNKAALPFQQASRQPVPEELWLTIRQGIEGQAQSSSPIEALMDRLKGLIIFPRLVPVFASLALMFLAGSVTLNTINIQRAQAKDQGEYLVSLLSTSGSSASSDSNDLGTPIEHYFL
jgi:anti-sigma factor RsiW